MTQEEHLAAIVAVHIEREGPLLPILNDIQEELGCVDEAAKKYLASALNLSRAEVHGVVSFYHDYKESRAKLPVLKLCGAEACQARGGEALATEIANVAQGRCQIETVYCLGLCSAGPNAMIGRDVHARLNSTKLQKLIEAL
ncbi:MAG: NAD(P)H-dependent oxidoreductase subunit E [Parasphingorhabdus sp.]|uniref:NAD(P)H-dependent oxidoreductase subunit E n=1 Tax=Parasphingorhabdus sp. TaxID=2709688 RepID=UPI0032671275